MFAAITWTHPIYGEVTEVLCLATHERPARAAFAELGIKYSAWLVAEGPCHRCADWRPWQNRPDTPDQAPAGSVPEAPPAEFGWFQAARPPRVAAPAQPAKIDYPHEVEHVWMTP